MKTASFHFQALAITLLLTCCDEPETADRPSIPVSENRQVTKSDRSPKPSPSRERDSLLDAIDRANSLTDPDERGSALATLVDEAQDVEITTAREILDQLAPGSQERARLLPHFAMRFAEQDSGEAVHWADSLTDEDERSIAFGNIALVRSADDPRAAAALLSESGVASHDFDVAVVQVIQRWAAQSPAEAAEWVVRFDPGEARAAGLQAIAGEWLDEDPVAAYDWIQGLTDPTIREEALMGMAESVITLPESRITEALRYASPELRLRVEKLKAEAGGE